MNTEKRNWRHCLSPASQSPSPAPFVCTDKLYETTFWGNQRLQYILWSGLSLGTIPLGLVYERSFNLVALRYRIFVFYQWGDRSACAFLRLFCNRSIDVESFCGSTSQFLLIAREYSSLWVINSSFYGNTLEPLLSGHHRGKGKWPLYRIRQKLP